MKNRLFFSTPGVFLFLFLTLPGIALPDDEAQEAFRADELTVMHPDRDTLRKWIQDYQEAPKAYIDEKVSMFIPPPTSYDLLGYLSYIPAERTQGSCGNCWVWAGTGLLEIALHVQAAVHHRLSIQYLNSCNAGDYPCCGEILTDLALFYSSTHKQSRGQIRMPPIRIPAEHAHQDRAAYPVGPSPIFHITR